MKTPDELIQQFALQPLQKVALTREQIKAIQDDARKDLLKQLEECEMMIVHDANKCICEKCQESKRYA